MKRLAVLLTVMCLLVGCEGGTDGTNRVLELRQRMLSGSCEFTATVTADYGDYLHTFVVGCAADLNGTVSFTVLAPDTISGITGSITGQEGTLTFDDQVLVFSPLADGQLGPVAAPWVLVNCLRSGYLVSVGETEQGLLLTIDDSYAEDSLRIDVRLNDEDIPVTAEIIWQGRRILTMKIENFRFV